MTEKLSENTAKGQPAFLISYHVILWPVLPILALYVNNFGTVDLSGRALFCMATIFALPTAILYGVSLLWKRKHLACCLLISLFWIMFFAIGQIVKPAMASGFRYRYLMLIYLLTLLGGGFFLFRSKSRMVLPTKIVNRMSLAFLIILCGHLAIKILPLLNATEEINRKITLKIAPTAEKRDVYYFLVDGYPGNKIVQSCYNFDNTSFTSYLKSKGCWVPEGFANYLHTRLVIPSLFLMDYVQNWIPKDVSYAKATQIVREGPAEHPLIQVMRQAGYEIIINRSSYIPSGVYRSDLVSHGKMSNMSTDSVQTIANFIDVTPAFPYFNEILKQFTLYSEPKIFEYFTETLSEKHDKPRLYFAHILLPHPPVRFSADGSELAPPSFAMRNMRDWAAPGMVGQFEYLNSELMSFVEKATQLSADRQPVILIHSDHGSATRGQTIEAWQNPTNGLLAERTSILYAAYLPGRDIKNFPKRTSPINMFRLFIREYLDPTFPLLENKSYFTESKQLSYDFKLIDIDKMELISVK